VKAVAIIDIFGIVEIALGILGERGIGLVQRLVQVEATSSKTNTME
jgi:hypothetical protein